MEALVMKRISQFNLVSSQMHTSYYAVILFVHILLV